MNEPNDHDWREAARRRPLTPEERARLEAHLADHPEERAGWEAELALTQALAKLPDAPLSPDFTARVLRAADQPKVRSIPVRFSWLDWLTPARRWQYASLAAVAGLAAWFAWQQRLAVEHAERALVSAQTELDRARLARDAATFHALAPVPSMEMLQDFEAISRLGALPADVDDDLLAATR